MATNGSIGSRTGVVGLFGHPVDHSLSPRMHNAAFREQGIDLVYVAFDVLPVRLPEAVGGLRALGLRGINVTIPHKEAIVGLLDEVEETARRIGSVNTVVNEQGRLRGYNTDKSGFAAALRSLRAEGAAGLACFVAGAGGGARGVVAALLDGGAREIRVYNRTFERAASLCQEAAGWGRAACIPVTEEEAAAAARAADLLVNATSVGLTADVKESAIPVDILHSHHIVMDLVYAPSPTRLVREAKAQGAAAIDGKEMLVMQAAGSYELWTGRRAPVEVMRTSIDEGR
jgi:shikimate dehydrogenase